MAVQPTSDCQYFCDFCLLQIPKTLTAARIVIVYEVKAASIAVTPVSDETWENFVLSTYDFYDSWLVYSTFKI